MIKTRKKLLIGAMIVIAMLFLGSVPKYLFASRMMDVGDRERHAFKLEILRALNPMNFNEEQWDKFDYIAEGIRAQGREFHDGMRRVMWKRMGSIRGMMREDGFDEDKANSIFTEARPVFVSMAEGLLRARNDIYGMLDGFQREKVDSILTVVESYLSEEKMLSVGRVRFNAMISRMNLTAEQRTEAELIINEAVSKMYVYANKAFEQMKTELSFMAEGSMSSGQIAESAEKLADLAAGALIAMGKARAQVWEILTPEQREEISSMRRRSVKKHRQ